MNELDTAKNRVYASLETLDGMWDGSARNAFYRQTASDRLTFQLLQNSLENLVECMEYAKSRYEKCREEVNEKIAGISISGDT